MNRTRKRLAVITALTTLGGVVPATGASAATTPAAAAPASVPPPALTFVPPKVGPIVVDIGPTILDGRVMDPGLHVVMPGISVPPIVSPAGA
jgi:hypothetical protein